MNRVMIDLEALGSGPTSAIVAIGAARFDCGGIVATLDLAVDAGSALACGMTLDAETLLWWLRQSDAARAQLQRPGVPLRAALERFAQWLGEDAEVWGNGAAFDNVILAHAYRLCGLPRPWPYRADRCYRTLAALYPQVAMHRVGIAHCARDDAVSQAEHLLRILAHAGLCA